MWNWVETRQNAVYTAFRDRSVSKFSVSDSLGLVSNSVHTTDTDKTTYTVLSCPCRRCELSIIDGNRSIGDLFAQHNDSYSCSPPTALIVHHNSSPLNMSKVHRSRLCTSFNLIYGNNLQSVLETEKWQFHRTISAAILNLSSNIPTTIHRGLKYSRQSSAV